MLHAAQLGGKLRVPGLPFQRERESHGPGAAEARARQARAPGSKH
jgi:hypothetical protein